MKPKQQHTALNILLADDDKDDRFFFAQALKELSIPTKLVTINNGERLMSYLSKNSEHLPDVLFLDLNMPRKNGNECLLEIKLSKKIQPFPVVIYSTSLNDDVADLLYENGAYYYIRKTDFTELKNVLHHILTMMVEKNFTRPSRDEFILSLKAV